MSFTTVAHWQACCQARSRWTGPFKFGTFESQPEADVCRCGGMQAALAGESELSVHHEARNSGSTTMDRGKQPEHLDECFCAQRFERGRARSVHLDRNQTCKQQVAAKAAVRLEELRRRFQSPSPSLLPSGSGAEASDRVDSRSQENSPLVLRQSNGG